MGGPARVLGAAEYPVIRSKLSLLKALQLYRNPLCLGLWVSQGFSLGTALLTALSRTETRLCLGLWVSQGFSLGTTDRPNKKGLQPLG